MTATIVNISKCLNVEEARSSPENMRSRIVMTDTKAESLNIATKKLPIGGITIRNAWGKTTYLMI